MTSRAVRILALGSCALTFGLSVAAVIIATTTPRLESSIFKQFGTGPAIVFGVVAISFGIVGAVITLRRPDNRLGWLLCADGLLIAVNVFASVYAYRGLVADPGSPPGGAWLQLVSDTLWGPFIAATTVFLFLLFPEGHLVGSGRRRAGLVAAISVAVIAIDQLLEPHLYGFPAVANPLGVVQPNALYVAIELVGSTILLGVFVYAITDLFRRRRNSTGDERLQFRWFGYSVLIILVLFLPTVVTPVPAWVQVVGAASLVTMPLAIAVSVLRYRLYDIDVVVKKTVVYGILAGLIVAVGAIVILVVGGIAVGPVSDNETLLITAGAVMGSSIWPLYRLASRLADRIVFKGRETPYEVLTSFADRVAETYSTDDVLPRMAQVLAAGTSAQSSTVWLRSGDRYTVAAAWPPTARPPAAIPIGATEVRHQGEVLGALSVEMPANDPMNPSKEALIRDLAAQAGLVLRNVRLIEDLRGSRRRIVAAQDERARKLERNIHDGAQQQLVALQVKIRLADTSVERDPAKAHELLADLQREANDALENLRDLARGIYPPLLADKGLPTALEAQARKSPLPVEVSGDGTGRYTPEIESAVYFSCLEALQNAAKYAHASRVTVRLEQTNRSLSFEVRDDGAGFDPTAIGYGTGLQGIADRLAALGGELVVTSAPGDGTAVAGRLPAEART